MILKRRSLQMPDPTFEKAFAGSRGWKRLDEVNAAEVPDIRRWMTRHSHERGVWTHPNGFKVVVVRHAGDFYARAIHQPLDVSEAEPIGYAAERAALVVASGLGLPDLVFKGLQILKGNSTREIGDGTVVAGSRGLAIQSKARNHDSGSGWDDSAERRWVTRQVKRAASQASGSIRSLKKGAVLENYRGRTVDIALLDVTSWVRVVIVDHQRPPEMELVLNDDDLVVLTRRDWEFLFRQLMSTSGVVDYVHRIAGSWPSRLGDESNRYFELALSDLDPEPSPVPAWVDPAHHRARPRHSILPASEVDERGVIAYRRILEVVATAQLDQGEPARIRILSALDQLAAEERAQIGRTLLERLVEMRDVQSGVVGWRATRVVPEFSPLQLCYAVTNVTDREKRTTLIGNFTSLRHAEFSKTLGTEIVTVVVTASPGLSVTGQIPPEEDWECTVCVENGPAGLDDSEIMTLQSLFGVGKI